MLLDYLLAAPGVDWYATEQDKVSVFRSRFNVTVADLPQRIYIGRAHRALASTTTRYFVHKLPIGLIAGDPAVVFAFLVTDTTGQSFGHFLQDHRRLLTHLPVWRIVAVTPAHIPGWPACQMKFQQVLAGHQPQRSAREVEDLRLHFRLRLRLDSDDKLADVPVAELNRFREFRERFSAAALEGLYQRWRAVGDAAFEIASSDVVPAAILEGRGQLVVHRLPVRYDRFGSRAGVA